MGGFHLDGTHLITDRNQAQHCVVVSESRLLYICLSCKVSISGRVFDFDIYIPVGLIDGPVVNKYGIA